MDIKIDKAAIESDALKANLLETAGQVEIDAELHLLLEIVEPYKGLHSTLEKLLYEVCHPFRNWKLVLPQLRSFALKNINYYRNDERGPEAFRLFARLFVEALHDTSRDPQLLAMAVSAVMTWLDKMLQKCKADDLQRFGPALNSLFITLSELHRTDKVILMQFVHGQYPLAKLGKRLLFLGKEGGVFDFSPFAELIKISQELCYEYWLSEDDPLSWFLGRCSIPVADSKSSQLFAAISHDVYHTHLDLLRNLDLKNDSVAGLETILELPDHIDIVKYYRGMPNKLVAAEEIFNKLEQDCDVSIHFFKENRKLLFLFKVMDTRGLYLIHEETLREVNRSLVQLIRQQSFEEIEEFLLTTFKLLKANVKKISTYIPAVYPSAGGRGL